jgi:hypothetical protein
VGGPLDLAALGVSQTVPSRRLVEAAVRPSFSSESSGSSSVQSALPESMLRADVIAPGAFDQA